MSIILLVLSIFAVAFVLMASYALFRGRWRAAAIALVGSLVLIDLAVRMMHETKLFDEKQNALNRAHTAQLERE